jgi:four helix bundle protein
MSLVVHQIALEAIAALRPLIPRIVRHDKELAKQLRDAASSAALNIGEAEYSDPGTRRARFHTAAGSANESRSAIAVATAWGYVTRDEAAAALELLDRVVAILWRLLHGRR